ncbi:MAG: malate synthase A [Bdellovibrionaceae bacterium]|nr:malate synthase A [Pseudobdellovibrionaceae bacterium]
MTIESHSPSSHFPASHSSLGKGVEPAHSVPTAGTFSIEGRNLEESGKVLSPDAIEFLQVLHRAFQARRLELLERRRARLERIRAGEALTFLDETVSVRAREWQVAAAPADLNDRRVEITGPAEAKMMINALNSGAKVFMADLEDALAPTWQNVILGQLALQEAVRGSLAYQSPEGKRYTLGSQLATLVVRPRGWHLEEKNVLVDGQPMSASLFDFGLYFFHNARALIAKGSGPYFYLPKMESSLEARLWNDVFHFAQDYLQIPRGAIRATVLIETILAAFEMDEILYELREHAAGLNAGRWDYLFSTIKTFAHDPHKIFPDRAQLTMTVPFMRAYTDLLVRTCHRRGAHAIGGMAAFIPSRRDAEVNELAFRKVREDKERESRDGFDGTWVAHPDLVPLAKEVFDSVLGSRPNQKTQMPSGSTASASALLPQAVPEAQEANRTVVQGGVITEEGLRNNINVALQYLEAWLRGQGAVAIHNLMEDAATAEISRAELWQWVHHHARLQDGAVLNASYFVARLKEELDALGGSGRGRMGDAATLLERLVVAPSFPDFLTIPAYELLLIPDPITTTDTTPFTTTVTTTKEH